MLLVRNGPLELEADHTNLIFAFQYAQLPSVNSLHSIYNTLHRPWVFSQLIAIRNRLGADSFPLIEQIMYSNHREMLATPRMHTITAIRPVSGVEKADQFLVFMTVQNIPSC
jgi:hypothetical protein